MSDAIEDICFLCQLSLNISQKEKGFSHQINIQRDSHVQYIEEKKLCTNQKVTITTKSHPEGKMRNKTSNRCWKKKHFYLPINVKRLISIVFYIASRFNMLTVGIAYIPRCTCLVSVMFEFTFNSVSREIRKI